MLKNETEKTLEELMNEMSNWPEWKKNCGSYYTENEFDDNKTYVSGW